MKLEPAQIHMMRLADKEAGSDGFAKVSKLVWPLAVALPDDLVEKRPSDDGGHIRLTDGGKTVLLYSVQPHPATGATRAEEKDGER